MMNCLSEIKITPRDRQVLELLVLGCSNKEVAAQLAISPRTVKQHLRTLFLRAGIREGRKRVKLATAMFEWIHLDNVKVEITKLDAHPLEVKTCLAETLRLPGLRLTNDQVVRLGKEFPPHAAM